MTQPLIQPSQFSPSRVPRRLAILLFTATLLLPDQVKAQVTALPRMVRIFPANALAGQFRVGYVHGLTGRMSLSGTAQYQIVHVRETVLKEGDYEGGLPYFPNRIPTKGLGITLGPRLYWHVETDSKKKLRPYVELLASGKHFGGEKMEQTMIYTWNWDYEGYYHRVVKMQEWSVGAQVMLGAHTQKGPFGVEMYGGYGFRQRFISTETLVSNVGTGSPGLQDAPGVVKQFCALSKSSVAKRQATLHLGINLTWDFAQPLRKSAPGGQ